MEVNDLRYPCRWPKMRLHANNKNKLSAHMLTYPFLKRFFSPKDMSGCYDQIRNFSIAKVWCCMDLYWSTRGCNLAAHSSIHASFILRRGMTRFQLPKGFLGLRIIECRNSSDILEWGQVKFSSAGKRRE